jgi:ATP-dependent protease ClpP protease subunit
MEVSGEDIDAYYDKLFKELDEIIEIFDRLDQVRLDRPLNDEETKIYLENIDRLNKINETLTATYMSDYKTQSEKDIGEGGPSGNVQVFGDKAILHIKGQFYPMQSHYFRDDVEWLYSQGHDEVYVYLDSMGGEVGTAFAMISVVNEFEDRIKFHARVDAVCASACIPIFAAFDERTAGEYAFFMLHEGEVRYPKLEDVVRPLYIAACLQGMTITADELSEMMRVTTFFDKKKAIEIGLVNQSQEVRNRQTVLGADQDAIDSYIENLH